MPEAPVVIDARNRKYTAQGTRMIPAVLVGSYCWGLTVAPKAFSGSETSSWAGVWAVVALVSLYAAPFLPNRRLAFIVVLDVFVLGCIGVWWASSGVELPTSLSVFGSFGWVAYTLALGALSKPSRVDNEVDPGPELRPRTPPSPLSALVLLGVVLTSLAVLGAAWRVERPALSVLAHVLSLGVVMLLLRSGAHLAVYLQMTDTRLESPLRLKRAVVPLLCLLVLLSGGLYWWSQGGSLH